jgi:ureidoglycolate dehydrogenase (NAD+)
MAHPDELTVSATELEAFTAALFEKVGVPRADARTVAGVLTATDLRGVFSHGTRMAPQYLQHLLDGHMKAQPQPRVERETAAMALIDADRGVGHLAAHDAMTRAIDKARRVGVGMVNVRHSHHLGAASIYAMMGLEDGVIGFVTTNTGGASVAPYGGRGGALANHPVAWAFPTRRPFPLVIDMAVGVSAWQRVETMRIYGQKLPPDWCLDKQGQPTEDPANAWLMLPAGGTRGYGLALVAGMLTGALSGGQVASRRPRYDPTCDSEHSFLAIAIDHFVPRDQFLDEVDEAIAACQRTPPMPGFDRVCVPGEIEWEKEQKWRAGGIPLHREHLARLARMAERLGVATCW